MVVEEDTTATEGMIMAAVIPVTGDMDMAGIMVIPALAFISVRLTMAIHFTVIPIIILRDSSPHPVRPLYTLNKSR